MPRIKTAACALILWSVSSMATSALAAPPAVAPGQGHAFTNADGGFVECRANRSNRTCGSFGLVRPLQARFSRSGRSFDVSAKTPLNTGLGLPWIASAGIFNDFSIPGPGTLVPVRVSVTYDYESQLLGAAAYAVSSEMQLTLADITAGAPGVQVGSTTLSSRERTGDQGFTDVSAGGQVDTLLRESGSLSLLLLRGRTYRITVAGSATAAALLVGDPSAALSAKWTQLGVHVDEDEFEALVDHDANMERLLRRHDSDIKAGQAEIIRLLLTPQGRRSSNFTPCVDPPCKFPQPPAPPRRP